MNIINRFIDLIFPLKEEKVISKEYVSKRVKEIYDIFFSYELKNIIINIVYIGLYKNDLNDFLLKNKNVAKDFFLISPDDYIIVYGATNLSNQHFVAFVIYTDNFEKKVGNFIQVNNWPPFQTFDNSIEDAYEQMYQDQQ